MFWGKPKEDIDCPYCLRASRIKESEKMCRHCGSEFPLAYRESHKSTPPIFVPLVGWTNVGKTVYLQALTHSILELGDLWSNFTHSPATEKTLEVVQEVLRSMNAGVMPEATPLETEEIYLMLLHDIERWGGRTLVMRDYSGELFMKYEIPREQLPFIVTAPITIFMFNVMDLKKNVEMRMDMLLQAYIRTMLVAKQPVSKNRKKIIVTFTQADRFIDDLTPEINRYLETDPFRSAKGGRLGGREMQEYVETMGNFSNHVEEWLLNHPDLKAQAHNFVHTARKNKIEVRYCVTSSTGSNLNEENRLTTQLRPLRILDPFFWALEFQGGASAAVEA